MTDKTEPHEIEVAYWTNENGGLLSPDVLALQDEETRSRFTIPLYLHPSSSIEEVKVKELINAARWVYEKLASETATVTIFDQERLGQALVAISSLDLSPKPLEITDAMIDRALARSRGKDLNTMTNSVAMREILTAALQGEGK